MSTKVGPPGSPSEVPGRSEGHDTEHVEVDRSPTQKTKAEPALETANFPRGEVLNREWLGEEGEDKGGGTTQHPAHPVQKKPPKIERILFKSRSGFIQNKLAAQVCAELSCEALRIHKVWSPE